MRRVMLAAALCMGALGAGGGVAHAGPLVLMGIDAEDGGVGGHGPISVYQNVVNNGVLADVTNGGSGILVIGGGKNPGDQVTAFWNAIDTAVPGSVTYVNGPAAIGAQSFSGFAMIAIASGAPGTPSGGLTQAENTALAARQADIAAFVNGGGGLMGLSQEGLSNEYAYLPDADQFAFDHPGQFQNITPTAEGTAVGITDALDVCCWHDEYTAFPAFLDVLATNAATGNAVALGGEDVVVPTEISLTPPDATNPVGTSHAVTATLVKGGEPQTGVEVSFEVTSGPHAGASGTCDPASCQTDAQGEVTFTYTGTAAGTDTIVASFVDTNGQTVTSNEVTKTWFAPEISIDDVSVTEGNAGTTPATFTVTLDQAVDAPVSVDFATEDVTTEPSDLEHDSGTVTFAANDTSETITVLVNGDTEDEEPDEQFRVQLSNPVNAVFGDDEGIGTIVDDDRNGAFSCRASALRLGSLLEPVVANPPDAPCQDDADTLATVNLGLGGVGLTVKAPNATTDQTPDDPVTTPPAVGDNAAAHADLEDISLNAGLISIRVTSLVADAKAECTSSGVPELSGSSQVAGLRVNGNTIDVGTQPIEIPLLLATLRLNQTVTSPGRITRRALILDNLILPDVVIGEATADFTGNPCDA